MARFPDERDGAPGLTIEEAGMRRTMQNVLSGIVTWVLVSSAPAFGADSAAGKSIFRQQCSVCHTAEPNDNGGAQGPSLIGVYGRHAAGDSSFGYTKALRDSKLTWNARTLTRFLASPTKAVPGTAMVVAVEDKAKRADLIEYFRSVKAVAANAPAARSKGATASV